ncbi:IclR family transcriptional regulator [Alkalihalobacillus sp. BA299]|uniref:IclR family transcriptional regulator n=1 Tax=Alkalihalobacillus sp. BA299 TaxID=2815938 RepID=UPI001ADCB128|nr:IclR family transcriptional regulator [Alkalihalobacillus sp. BA299]
MVKSIEKMLKILSLYTMDRTSLSISEIQEELNYPKSTIFRLLDTLEAYNYIERNLDNHRYSLGFNFFRLGSIVQNQLDFRSVSLPIMKSLMEQTNETVELNVIDGSNRICVEKVDSPLDVRNFVRIGERKPIHLGASGKVLLTFLPENEKKQVIENLGNEISSYEIEQLLEEMESIKSSGYCVTTGERVPGSFAVAVPLFGQNGQMVASLTIAGPIQRLSDERERELIEILLKGATEINERLGYMVRS